MYFPPRSTGAPFSNQHPFMVRPSNFTPPTMFGNMSPRGVGARSSLLGKLFGNQQMGGGMPFGSGLFGLNQMMPTQRMPFSRQIMGRTMPHGGGGILSKLLGGGVPGGPLGTGGASGIDIVGMLNNVQKVLGVTQQALPLVQQYGPLVKNLPAIFKMMKAINSQETESSTESTTETDNNNESIENESIEVEVTENQSKESEKKVDNDDHEFSKKGLSRPKLYI